MKLFAAVILGFMLTVNSGCGNNAARELFDTAQLEERQFNMEHAKKLYGEIIEKYPDSEYHHQAEERLKAIEKNKSG